jgi:hypothetical protein
MARASLRLGLLLAALLSLGQSGGEFLRARDPGDLSGFPVEDQIDLVQVDNRVLAIDARSQRTRDIQLEVGEQVIGLDTRGLVAVVRTTARVLGIGTRLSTFLEVRYRVGERAAPPTEAFLGDRVAFVPVGHRLLAMSTTTQNWLELDLGPRETIGEVYTQTNVVATTTSRRAIAFAPRLTTFAEILLTPTERVLDVSTSESSVTITTPRRILIFRAGSGQWSELLRKNLPS